jgi:trimethylamine--corrinoid protein Co-methyltransferase
MVAQINAEILAGITLAQLAREGAPVLYGSVPVRARMDNLHDMYGAPEFCQYNASCAQMARFYQLPCYSTAGVADSSEPGLQAAIEKMYSYLYVGLSGAQYIHYAFGLLERTSTFSPEQAVIDNELVGMCKFIMREPDVTPESCETYHGVIKKVMESSHKLYTRYVRKDIRSGKVYLNFPLESEDGAHGVLINAHRRVGEILAMQPEHIPRDTVSEIYREIPSLLERLNPYRKEE